MSIFLTILNFIKSRSSNIAKYVILSFGAILILIISFQIKKTIKNYYLTKEQNLILTEKLNKNEEIIKNQELIIKNYKKIFQKQLAINLKLSKIKIDEDKLNFTNKNAQQINKILNCHIDNFKNLDANCED